GSNTNVPIPPADNAETSITINPTNTLNRFATSTAGNKVFRYSLNGGATWNNSNISAVLGGISGGDQQAAWDNFGNLFVTYFAGGSPTPLVPQIRAGAANFTPFLTPS